MRVIAITPVWNEDLAMIQEFKRSIDAVGLTLNQLGIGFSHYFLDDAATYLPAEYPTLVRHRENEGLARTLLQGYLFGLNLEPKPDIVVRLDCQEHDPNMIIQIVDSMMHSASDAIFLPVYYWIKDQPRPLMREITFGITSFIGGLCPVDRDIVLGTYNVVFPLGFQAYRASLISKILPELAKGIRICEEITGKTATWGLDLLAILLAAKDPTARVDFLFGGWSEPWLQNRGSDKVAAQQSKADVMIQVAQRLGCLIKE